MPITFWVIQKDTRTERYWLAETARMGPLLAASFYTDESDAKKELVQLTQGQYPSARIIKCYIDAVLP